MRNLELDNNAIISKIVSDTLAEYDLKDIEFENMLSNVAFSSIKNYVFDQEKGLSDELSISNHINNYIDKCIIELSKTNIDIRKKLLERLNKIVKTSYNISKDLKSIQDIDYYMEFAIIKAMETYDADMGYSLNLYTVKWFLALAKGYANENSETLEKVLIK